MHTCLLRRLPSLTSARAAFAVQTFFPYLSSQRYFFCLSLRNGAEAFFGLAFVGIKIRGSFHLSASLLLIVSASVSVREGEVGSGCAALFPPLPARDWSVRSCVRACVLCVVWVSVRLCDWHDYASNRVLRGARI